MMKICNMIPWVYTGVILLSFVQGVYPRHQVLQDLGLVFEYKQDINPCTDVHKLVYKVKLPHPPMNIDRLQLCENNQITISLVRADTDIQLLCNLLGQFSDTTEAVRENMVTAMLDLSDTQIASRLKTEREENPKYFHVHGHHSHRASSRVTNPRRYRQQQKRNAFTRFLGLATTTELNQHKKVVFQILRAHDSKLDSLKIMQDSMIFPLFNTMIRTLGKCSHS
jgi:hypothetical protein